jgi:hypothetical protein
VIFSRKLDAFLQGKDEFSTELPTSHKPVEFVCLLFIILAMGTHYAGSYPKTESGVELLRDLAEIAV